MSVPVSPTPEPREDPAVELLRAIFEAPSPTPDEQAAEETALLLEVARLRGLVGEEDQPGWNGCSRAEAIRQANTFHEKMRYWGDEHDKRRNERDDALAASVVVREQLTQREAELASLKEYLTASTHEAFGRNRMHAMAMQRIAAAIALHVHGPLGDGGREVCDICTNEAGTWEDWPCPTVLALTAGTTGPTEDVTR